MENIKISKSKVSNETNKTNFHLLEVLVCGSEASLQMGENL